MKKRIIFVCSGNTCRSPMAEYIFKKNLKISGLSKYFSVRSAGIFVRTGAIVSPLAVQAVGSTAPTISKHVAKEISQKMLDCSTAVFCLTQQHKRHLLDNYKNLEEKCFLVREFIDNRDIDDPFGGTLTEYQKVKDQITTAIESILKFLTLRHEN